MGLPIARDVLSTLREFRAAQEERVQRSNAFSEGFTAYLNNRQEGPYRHALSWACACNLHACLADGCRGQPKPHSGSQPAVSMCDARQHLWTPAWSVHQLTMALLCMQGAGGGNNTRVRGHQ